MDNNSTSRLKSLDIMRGINLFLMLFVNDLYEKGVPKWLVHTQEETDGMGLADVVFPCFLFLVGVSIPFALSKRILTESKFKTVKHILTRTISLLLIGLFMVNSDDYNETLTGVNKYLWILTGYISVFLIWNKYPDNRLVFKVLRFLGLIIFLTLFIIYRAGSAEVVGYIKIHWWGILGLIGWGYLVSALCYLFLKDNLKVILVIFLIFISLNCLSQFNMLSFLDDTIPFLGVIFRGSVPSIVLAGLLMGFLLKKYANNSNYFFKMAIPFGLISIVSGFILRKWFIISKIKETPSWCLICIGISTLVFVLIYFITDIKKESYWAKAFLPAGKNSLTTYLFPDIVYYVIWSTSLPIFFYKQTDSQALAVIGSLAWAFLMIKLADVLVKNGIQLKL